MNRALKTIEEDAPETVPADHASVSVLADQRIAATRRAEIHSLLARNAKTRWRDEWETVPEPEQRIVALRSRYLDESREQYERGFYEDLSHFYSGLNALAMLTVSLELAQAQPDVWATLFRKNREAEAELQDRQERKQTLADAVAVSLDATMSRLKRQGKRDIWADISVADLSLITASEAARVAAAYRKALAGAPDFAVDSARNQILLYQRLALLTDNVAGALSAFPAAPQPKSATATAAAVPQRVLLFTGHRLDQPDRATPRFPAVKVVAAKNAIREVVASEQQKEGGIAYGMSGGACGGDILFHQVCAELGIDTQIFLALPRDQYVRESVAHGGADWIEEFDRLCRTRPVRVLGETKELPRWLQDKPRYTIWQRSNLWMLFNAFAVGSANVTLIALWNREGGDGPGGTADMVAKVNERGAKARILDTTSVLAT